MNFIHYYVKEGDHWVRRYVGTSAPELEWRWTRDGIEWFRTYEDLGATIKERP